MIRIRIENPREVARQRNLLAHFVPGSVLEVKVERAIAEKIRDVLAAEGVRATVTVGD